MEMIALENLKFDASGLIPAVVQDADTNQVLMLAYMNAEFFQITLETKETDFWSRSRQELWHKGATSGNTQQVIEVKVDCDADTLLISFTAGQLAIRANKLVFIEISRKKANEHSTVV